MNNRNDSLWATLPKSALTSLSAPWSTFEPFYAELVARTITTDSLERWMLDWSMLLNLLREIDARLSVAKDLDTTDKAAEKRFLEFQESVGIPSDAEDQKLREKLLASGLTPENYELPLVKLRLETEIFREANLPLGVEEQELGIEYARIRSTQTVPWNGAEVTLVELEREFLNPDRTVRERAWRLTANRALQDVPALTTVWQKLLTVRQRMAANAGENDFRSYQWKALSRLDYTPDDCKRLSDAILEAVVPAATSIYEAHRTRMGLSSLRPWDLMDGWYAQPVGTADTPALAPFKTGAELAERSLAIFTRLDPALGRDFKTMIDEGLLDLENKRGKAPGAYCTAFEVVRRPYILMNAIGTHDDVQTMLHEAGHAFHEFAYAGLPHPGQRAIPMEFAEVASMGMELLAAPFLAREHGGFYSTAEAARAQIEHLERSILFWPFMAVVDQFQHWVYEHPAAAADGERASAHWDTLWQKFIPAVDYSGFESYRASGWQRKQHIFNAPFYYVEYGLAQLGAQQVWKCSLTDPAEALRQYREALSLGGTVALPELFRIAGGKLSCDKQTLKEAVEFASAQIRKLRQVA